MSSDHEGQEGALPEGSALTPVVSGALSALLAGVWAGPSGACQIRQCGRGPVVTNHHETRSSKDDWSESIAKQQKYMTINTHARKQPKFNGKFKRAVNTCQNLIKKARNAIGNAIMCKKLKKYGKKAEMLENIQNKARKYKKK